MDEILCTICARGGSKGVKGKNTRLLSGKPLIVYTIEIAKKWDKFSDIALSTDSEEIIGIANRYGITIPFKRPANLSGDDVGKVEVIKHLVKFFLKKNKKYDVIIDLEVTSPFRVIEDLDNAYRRFKEEDFDIVYSVCEARRNPYFNVIELDKNNVPHLSKDSKYPIYSRQKAPEVYELNGAIYIYKTDFLLNSKTIHGGKAGIYIMPQERSVDIDSEFDFKIAECVMKGLK
jgi:CMP-N,N'-diacetyllegionaminic acid synthase